MSNDKKKKEASLVEQMWDRVAGMVETPALPWSKQPRGVQDMFIQAVNVFGTTGDYTLAKMCFDNAVKKA